MRHRRQKFIALAEKRVTRTIKDLRLIGNLANKSNYEYDNRDIEKIMKVLEGELRVLKRRFEAGGVKDVIEFKL